MKTGIAYGRFPGGTGLVSYTDTSLGGLTPKAALLCWVGADVLDDNDGHSNMGFGAYDGTRQWAISGVSEDGEGTSNCKSIHSTGACILKLDDSGGADGAAVGSQFITNGIELNWTVVPGDDWSFFIVLFAGDDVSVRADTYTLGAEDVDTDITAPGFRPKLIWGSTRGGGSSGGIEDDQRLSIGAAVDNGAGYDQRCWFFADRDGEGTSNIRQWIWNNRVGGRDAFYTVEFDDPDANGFSSYTRDDSPSSDSMSYLALDFDNDVEVFAYEPPNATGNQAKTGIGFLPELVVLGATSHNTENNQGLTGPWVENRGFGVFNTTQEYMWITQNEDAEGTTSTASSPENVAARLFQDHTSGSRKPDASFVSMDADGFTLNYATAGYFPARKWWGVAIGEEPAATGQQFMMVT